MLTVASAFANQTYDWIQTTLSITYAADGVTELSRLETTYDTEGRQIGYKQYSNGELAVQYRDYQYNGRTATFWYDLYSGGSVKSSFKAQTTYKEATGSTDIVETQCIASLPVAYYSILGQKLLKEPESGLYIIVYENGKAEKVLR